MRASLAPVPLTSGELSVLPFGAFAKPAPAPGVAVPPAGRPVCAYAATDSATARTEAQKVLTM
ncbi:hypothetical protein CUJ87_22665 [Paraburkholderia caledonica]|nr:hypothetical protein CUJ87_22665 [Paraburkholderia caledonica]